MLQKVVGQKGFLDAVAGLTDANSCLPNVTPSCSAIRDKGRH